MKKFLIYTGVGDISTQYKSWFKTSNVYDIAINFYGKNRDIVKNIAKTTTYLSQNKGMIFKNFAHDYKKFKQYEYVLILDSDIEAQQEHIEDSFKLCLDNDISALSWSRTPGAFGQFNSLYEQNNLLDLVDTNYIEMNFTFIKKDLLKLLVEKWFEIKLEYSTAIDSVMSNIAYHNNMLPFKIWHKYSFYNPWPADKAGIREIDTLLSGDQRIKALLEYKNKNRDYFIIDKIISYNGKEYSLEELGKQFNKTWNIS